MFLLGSYCIVGSLSGVPIRVPLIWVLSLFVFFWVGLEVWAHGFYGDGRGIQGFQFVGLYHMLMVWIMGKRLFELLLNPRK